MTLKGITISVLFVFFDWLLSVRKDRLGAAEERDGCLAIDPLMNSQMHGVRESCSTPLPADQY